MGKRKTESSLSKGAASSSSSSRRQSRTQDDRQSPSRHRSHASHAATHHAQDRDDRHREKPPRSPRPEPVVPEAQYHTVVRPPSASEAGYWAPYPYHDHHGDAYHHIEERYGGRYPRHPPHPVELIRMRGRPRPPPPGYHVDPYWYDCRPPRHPGEPFPDPRGRPPSPLPYPHNEWHPVEPSYPPYPMPTMDWTTEHAAPPYVEESVAGYGDRVPDHPEREPPPGERVGTLHPPPSHQDPECFEQPPQGTPPPLLPRRRPKKHMVSPGPWDEHLVYDMARGSHPRIDRPPHTDGSLPPPRYYGHPGYCAGDPSWGAYHAAPPPVQDFTQDPLIPEEEHQAVQGSAPAMSPVGCVLLRGVGDDERYRRHSVVFAKPEVREPPSWGVADVDFRHQKDEDLRVGMLRPEQDLRETFSWKHPFDVDLREREHLPPREMGDLRSLLKQRPPDLRDTLTRKKADEDLRCAIERMRSPGKSEEGDGRNILTSPVSSRSLSPSSSVHFPGHDLRGQLERRREGPQYDPYYGEDPDAGPEVLVRVASALKECLDDYEAMETNCNVVDPDHKDGVLDFNANVSVTPVAPRKRELLALPVNMAMFPLRQRAKDFFGDVVLPSSEEETPDEEETLDGKGNSFIVCDTQYSPFLYMVEAFLAQVRYEREAESGNDVEAVPEEGEVQHTSALNKSETECTLKSETECTLKSETECTLNSETECTLKSEEKPGQEGERESPNGGIKRRLRNRQSVAVCVQKVSKKSRVVKKTKKSKTTRTTRVRFLLPDESEETQNVPTDVKLAGSIPSPCVKVVTQCIPSRRVKVKKKCVAQSIPDPSDEVEQKCLLTQSVPGRSDEVERECVTQSIPCPSDEVEQECVVQSIPGPSVKVEQECVAESIPGPSAKVEQECVAQSIPGPRFKVNWEYEGCSVPVPSVQVKQEDVDSDDEPLIMRVRRVQSIVAITKEQP